MQIPSRAIKYLVSSLILLTLFDLVATIYWISSGLATEANPILAHAIEKSYIFFAIVKFVFAFTGIFLLDRFKEKRNKLIFDVSILMVFVYSGVAVWHLFGLLTYLL